MVITRNIMKQGENMPKNLFLLFLTLLIFGCARVNQESRDYYQSEKKMRHGIIPTETDPNLKPIVAKLDQASVDRGQILYQQNCLECHGVDGQGHQAGHLKAVNLKKLAKEVNNFKFFMSISQWQGDMPGWKSPFSEADREDLTNYIKSLALKN